MSKNFILVHTMTIIDKIMIFYNDVNKTRLSIELLEINILRYFVVKEVT